MSITGKILIDKLRISIPISILNELGINTEYYVNVLKTTLEKYFYSKSAFSIGTSRGYLRITLTPTRFKQNDNSTATDTNLEMPFEDWLLNLLHKSGFYKNRRLNESAKITWIHLTKNVITNRKPQEYITFLANYPHKQRFISSLISSSWDNTSLRLSTSKRNTTKMDIIGDRTFIFYDKTQELKDKANKGIIILKNSLNKDEVKLISDNGGCYLKKGNILNIRGLNLMRCELQYRYKDKIKPIQKFLNPKSKGESLTVANILDLLSRKELYSKLNSFYVKELKSVIFYKLPHKQERLLTSYQKAFSDLLDKSDNITLQLTYELLNFGKIFQENKMNLQKNDCSLYDELYQKFIGGENY